MKEENAKNPDKILENIQKAKAGDSEAFEYLYSQFYTPLFNFIKWRTNDSEKTKDLVQEVFVKWYQSLQSYEVKMKPLNYLYTIATRLIINDSQKKKSLQLDEDAEEFIADESENLESILNTQINFSKTKQIISEELSETEQNVISLKYLQELENREISEILSLKENNLRQIEYRALKKLRDKLKENL